MGLLYWPTQLTLTAILAVAIYLVSLKLSAIIVLAAIAVYLFFPPIILLSVANIISKNYQFGWDSTQREKINHVKSIINELQNFEETVQNDIAELRFESALRRNGQRNTLPIANAFVLGEEMQPEVEHPENR